MNLLFLNSIETSVYGGMEEWIRLVAAGLSRRGHNVTVAGRPGSAFLRRLSSPSNGFDTVTVNLSGDFNPVSIARVRSLLRERAIDLVCVNFNRDIRLGGLAARLGGDVPVVWSVGLDITKDNLVHRTLTPRLVDGVIVPSQALKRQVTRHGYIPSEKVTVIPIGIDGPPGRINREEARKELQSRFGFQNEDIICVTSGRLVEQKGHSVLVDAAQIIVQQHKRVRFLWLGDGPLADALRSQIQRLGLESHFVLAGMQENVQSLLPGCDLMIHPSVEEPFGVAIVEAMRASLPVVASRVGGIPEVVAENETAILVEPREPEALSIAVNDLLGDPARLQTMGAAGFRRWRDRFQLEGMIDHVERYFAGTTDMEKTING